MGSRDEGEGRPTWARRIGVAALWLLLVLEVLGMGMAGLSKFVQDGWANMFEGWGYPRPFTYVIGAAELGGALLLLVPRLTAWMAPMLITIMLGAIYTVLTNETRLGPGVPTIHIAVLSILAAWRWNSRWTPGA